MGLSEGAREREREAVYDRDRCSVVTILIYVISTTHDNKAIWSFVALTDLFPCLSKPH